MIRPIEDWEKEYEAPEGYEWMCVACGRHGPNLARIGDESCFLNGTLVKWNSEKKIWEEKENQ